MNSLRAWATPLTIGAFILMGITGILMFFGLNSTLSRLAHEWLSWAFLAGVGIHVTSNFIDFKRYFRAAAALAIIGVFVAILSASILLGGAGVGEIPVREVLETVHGTSITKLASLVGETPDALSARIEAGGFEVDSPEQTLADLSGHDQAKALALIRIVFKKE